MLHSHKFVSVGLFIFLSFVALPQAFPQGSVRAHILLRSGKSAARTQNDSNVVVWLSPVTPTKATRPAKPSQLPLQLVQKNKTFIPHMLVVPVGSRVEFPNRDPFFHSVFSLFEGKKYDLGLYESGTVRDMRFDQEGVYFIFCNIHSEMSAVVIALNTPYYAISRRSGHISIPEVPAGKYEMKVFYESSSPEDLKSLSREVTVGVSGENLGEIRVPIGQSLLANRNGTQPQSAHPAAKHQH